MADIEAQNKENTAYELFTQMCKVYKFDEYISPYIDTFFDLMEKVGHDMNLSKKAIAEYQNMFSYMFDRYDTDKIHERQKQDIDDVIVPLMQLKMSDVWPIQGISKGIGIITVPWIDMDENSKLNLTQKMVFRVFSLAKHLNGFGGYSYDKNANTVSINFSDMYQTLSSTAIGQKALKLVIDSYNPAATDNVYTSPKPITDVSHMQLVSSKDTIMAGKGMNETYYSNPIAVWGFVVSKPTTGEQSKMTGVLNFPTYIEAQYARFKPTPILNIDLDTETTNTTTEEDDD